MKNVEAYYPLSPLQQGFLFHTQLEGRSGVYTVQFTCEIHGPLSAENLQQAWQSVLDHHASLRTAFVGDGAEALQVVGKRVRLPWQEEDWRDLPQAEQEERFRAHLQADREEGFELTRAPLMRCTLIRLADHRYRFLWTHHHLLLDGWSVSRVLQEAFSAYRSLRQGEAPQFETGRPYMDYIAWLEKQDLAAAERFWRDTLRDFDTPTRLDIDHGSQGAAELRYREARHTLSAAETGRLQQCARRHRVTLNTLFQGAWAVLLSRYSSTRDVLFGVVVSGRPQDLPGAESMVGLFINTLPLRVRVEGRMPVQTWLARLMEHGLALRDYEYTPLTQVQRWSAVPAGQPLFETITVFENYPTAATASGSGSTAGSGAESRGDRIELRQAEILDRPHYPLSLIIAPGEEILLRLGYDATRIEAGTAEAVLSHLGNLLASLAATDGEQPLRNLSMLSPAERQQLLVEWNETGGHYERDLSIPALFARQAQARGDATALVCGDVTLSYRELDERSDGVAAHLRSRGVMMGDRVGVYLDRSLELVVALLGILKAGGAYVPIELDTPQERLRWIFQEAAVGWVLTARAVAAGRSDFPYSQDRMIDIEDLLASPPKAPSPPAAARLDGGALAYVMYTSGSTGRPKGVCVPHRAVIRLVQDPNFMDIGAEDVFLQFAPVAFDASTLEIWGPLLNGGRLAVMEPGVASLEELGEALVRHGVTSLWLTAGLFHQMVERCLPALSGVRQLLAGGDVLSLPRVLQVVAELDCRMINGYGPTENTTFTCCHTVSRSEVLETSVPIGRPITGTQCYVLDRELRPVPVGVVGELYAGGDGLAQGYVSRSRLTADRFVPNPYGEAGSRLYRTGDEVRWTDEGTLEFLGRRDLQVKLRGYRIELGEIESVLMAHEGVEECVVLVHGEGAARHLVAFVVPSQDPPPGQEASGDPQILETQVTELLRTYLQEHLPHYMVPTVWVSLGKLPLTVSGKVDRRRIAAQLSDSLPEPRGERVAPRTETERVVAQIWEEVLQCEALGVEENFFELGGQSLLATQVISRIRERLGVSLPLRRLFDTPTVAALAAGVEESRSSGDAPRQPQMRALPRDGQSWQKPLDEPGGEKV